MDARGIASRAGGRAAGPRRPAWAVLALASALGAGCAPVHFTERRGLGDPIMDLGGCPTEGHFRRKATTSREGAAGGFSGGGGGGCGCY